MTCLWHPAYHVHRFNSNIHHRIRTRLLHRIRKFTLTPISSTSRIVEALGGTLLLVERVMILRALKPVGDNHAKAAKHLRIIRRSPYMRKAKFNID
ncbi:hypothetical protein [Burkholderia contaminans]|uniref:hypothetical protein n=1 Tax=Burkholderia contaminans TaxID=488447 RepID=UPI0008F46801|nr:hypothetical protein [Burkholderia contaminans]